MLTTEVLVIGAGPAGSTAALNLAPTRRVILVERRLATTQRIGESVPPAVSRLLADMGLFQSFLREGHAPCYGNRSTWGGSAPAETDFLRDLDGHGWHIDRNRFEAWLRESAVDRGATLLAPAEVRAIERYGAGWRVLVSTDRETECIVADFVIDAGGRSTPFAARLGAHRSVLDRLICGWIYGRTSSGGRGAGFTYVEAEQDGWWYTSPLPNDRRVLAFHTDADLPAARAARSRDAMLARAKEHSELAAVLAESDFAADTQFGFAAAHTAALDPCAGPAWMAVGDAALSFDPLSDQGILNGMFTALASAEATDRYLSGNDDVWREYVETVRGIRRVYMERLKSWYQAERRWPNAAFWRRRQNP